jgi:aconitate hydratase
MKKQDMLPLTFADPADYDRIEEGDCITLKAVEVGELRPGSSVIMQVQTKGGES